MRFPTLLLLALVLAVPRARAQHGGSGSSNQGQESPRTHTATHAGGQHYANTGSGYRSPGIPARTRIILPPRQERIPQAPARRIYERPAAPRNPPGVSPAPGRSPNAQPPQTLRQPVELRTPQAPGQAAPRADWSKETAPLTTAAPRTWEQPARPPKQITDRHLARPPTRDENGNLLRELPLRHAPNHERIVSNKEISGHIDAYNRTENERGHYYWHNDGGVHYCHYYDRNGTHWYGFYVGTTYYWSRYEADHWWWYDPGYSRWLYWDDGDWWWQSPTQQAYVYSDNDNYVAFSSAAAEPPAVQAPAPSGETDVQNGDTLYSADGSRMIQIFGDRNEAFLYERYAGEEPQFLAFLGQDVTRVQFSNATDPGQLQILLHFKNGSFSILDNRGMSYQAPSPASAAPPSDLPGPPTP